MKRGRKSPANPGFPCLEVLEVRRWFAPAFFSLDGRCRMSVTKLVNAGDLAAVIGVRVSTMHKWARLGRVPCIRPTSRTLGFDLDEVIRAMEQPVAGDTNDARCDDS
jgi:hypothetical protein